MTLGLAHGLKATVDVVRGLTDAPVIYDHQKFGTDVPAVCGGAVVSVFAEAGLSAVIIFPEAGIRTLEASVAAVKAAGLVPIVGGEMTHPGYLSSDGGYIEPNAPMRMYEDAARLGVQHFVVPGTHADSMIRYKDRLSALVDAPAFMFPGIGRGQGGDIVEAFRAVLPAPAYAIVGRGISEEQDKRGAAERLWSSVAAEPGLNPV
jgi:orotidine-5'-phosphate decarboxylase